MGRYFGAAVFLALLVQDTLALRSQLSSAVTPVEKVVQLLKKLQSEVSENGAKEAAEYDKFACFCKEQSSTKTHHIKRSDERIEELEAAIEAIEASIAELNTEIVALGEDISSLETKITEEIEARKAEHERYLEEDKELSNAIDAITRAMETLQASRAEVRGDDASLAQVLSGSVLATVKALIAQKPAGYKYQSNDIIATLQTLLRDFKANKKEADDAEFEAMDASQKRTLGWSNEKKFKEKAKKQKEMIVGAKEEDKHQKTQDKEAEEAAREADKSFLKELTSQCEEKGTEFDQRSKARAGELSALGEALEILKSGVESMYGANKKLVDLAQRPVSLVQLDGSSAVVQRVLERLDGEAKRLGSVVLSALATKVVLQQDHFVKVRGLINDLITRLEEQKVAEAKQKSFCDKQMGKATESRDKQALAIEEATATISMKEAERKELLMDIKALSVDIAGLNKALNEATELRGDEKATNEGTIADAKAGKAAVADAITVLSDFYGASALLQATAKYVPPNSDREGKTVGDRAPEMSYSGDYKGQTESSKGIIGLLQVIESDFGRTETTVGEAEKEAQSKFEEFETETKASIEAKEGEKTEKETAVKEAVEAITQAKDDANDARTLHQGALGELDKLRPMCVDGEESYEERRKKRQDEIAALKAALRILEDWQAL